METTTTSRFEEGAEYSARSFGDYDCVWTFLVLKRTAKFITISEASSDEILRVGVKTDKDGEWALPFGSYSLAPVIRASDPEA